MEKKKVFNSGVAYIYKVVKSEKDITSKQKFFFKEEFIGYKRYTATKAANEVISRLISIPATSTVNAKQQVVIEKSKYKITQVQKDESTIPITNKLTLEYLGEENE